MCLYIKREGSTERWHLTLGTYHGRGSPVRSSNTLQKNGLLWESEQQGRESGKGASTCDTPVTLTWGGRLEVDIWEVCMQGTSSRPLGGAQGGVPASGWS